MSNKISSYSYATSPTTNDYLLGNTASGPVTSKFKIQDIGKALGTNSTVLLNLNNPYKFTAYRSASIGIANATWSKIPFDSKEYDTGSNYDATTNYRFTPPMNGYYKFDGLITFFLLANTHVAISLYKNGVSFKKGFEGLTPSATTNCSAPIAVPPIYLTTTDYVELWAYQAQGSSGTIVAGSDVTFFGGFLCSAT